MIEYIREEFEGGDQQVDPFDIVPPLESDLPLSYRSGDSDLYSPLHSDRETARLQETDVDRKSCYTILDPVASYKASSISSHLQNVPSLHLDKR